MEGDRKVNEYDRYLPVANIGRIIKNNLPCEIKLSKEAKEIFQECVSEFISFVTSEASDKCNSDKRKTMNGDDVLQAMKNLGFDRYVPILKVYLDKYRESQKYEYTQEDPNKKEPINFLNPFPNQPNNESFNNQQNTEPFPSQPNNDPFFNTIKKDSI